MKHYLWLRHWLQDWMDLWDLRFDGRYQDQPGWATKNFRRMLGRGQ